MKCIEVNSPDRLYLATENLIPTHNSDLLLGLALTQHHKTLYLRNKGTELHDIVSRVKSLIDASWHWRGVGNGGVATRKRPDGLVDSIEFAGCDSDDAAQKFKGRAHDLKCYDELSDIQESVYTFVNGWNRTSLPNQRCRIVAASNPPVTTAGEWIIKRWRAWLDPSAGNAAKIW